MYNDKERKKEERTVSKSEFYRCTISISISSYLVASSNRRILGF